MLTKQTCAHLFSIHAYFIHGLFFLNIEGLPLNVVRVMKVEHNNKFFMGI